ncbi:DUF1599 domain-containing protein [Anoxybacillus flavithermus]|uniref:nucleotide modification associated domain-containing protein n=1 Tax=Anoxybacillus flavithermus TaxID=33934 RepID=UPI0018681DD9|nr:nucleotide modification associated domain-containing protein [Anoxybacillus flavithermus]MBE2917333.1 DUF1599 domain-containing protein [Anoxybacillus flavithermus]
MKFKVGDKVKVVKNSLDKNQYLEVGTIEKVEKDDGDQAHCIVCIDGEYLWFLEDELELFDNNVIINNSNIELHKKILNEIHDTYKRKNADYGNSFGEQFIEYGLLSAVIRLDDKMRRLKQLLKNEAQVKDESIRDTLLDLSNYAIMTIMELDKKNE